MTDTPLAVHIMHDFESLAKDTDVPNLLTLGAAKFTREGIIDRFIVRFDTEDCERFGLKIEAGTVKWWFDDKRQAAREAIAALGEVDLYAGLDGYAQWINQTPTDQRGSAWSKGSNFDNAKLKSIYKKVGLEWPFSYKQEECYRTMVNRFPDVPFEPQGIGHSAIDDAVNQALHLIAICEKHGIEL